MDPPQPLSPSKSKSQSQIDLLGSYLTPITSAYPDYTHKISSLQLHKQQLITNPKSFINLFESSELNNQQNLDKKIQMWGYILDYVNLLFKIMPINATFVFKQAKFVCNVKDEAQGQSQVIDAIQYVIYRIFWFLAKLRLLKVLAANTDDQEQTMKFRHKQKKILEVVDKLYVLYCHFIQNCYIQSQTLKLITRLLCHSFYQNTLTPKSLSVSYALFTQLSTTSTTLQTGNAQPFLYFNGSAKIGLRLLLTNNKWPFIKGMHLCIWIKSFLEIQANQGYVMFLKVDDKNWVRVRQERVELVVESSVQGDKNKKRICDFPVKCLVKLEVVLEPKQSGGLFKSNTEYRMHIRLNGQDHKNIEIKLPKFDNSDFVTEFNMFGDYIGQIYAISLWKSTLSYAAGPHIFPDTLADEAEVNNFVEGNEKFMEDMVTLLTPLRTHKGILINMIDSEQNHACHQASMLFNQTQNKNNRFLTSTSKLILPYLYFTIKLHRQCQLSPSSFPNPQQTKFQTQKLLNILLQQYCKSRISYCQQSQQQIKKLTKVKNPILQNYKLTIMYIFYWLENIQYAVNEQTLIALMELTLLREENYQPLFYKYIDRNLLNIRNLRVEEVYAKIRGKRKGDWVEQAKEGELCDPVTKLQILFYLQTNWRQLWNKYQYMTQWWQPFNLKMQNDQPFDQSHYTIKSLPSKQPPQAPKHAHIEWQVSEFITNDFCDCLIVPLILQPNYIKLGQPQIPKPSPFIFTKYQQTYTKKQCMTQEFGELSFLETILDKQDCNRFYFKKIMKSFFGKIFDKVTKSDKEKEKIQEKQKKGFQISGKKIIKAFSGDDWENMAVKYQSDVSYLNLLTLIIGTISIQMKGKSAFICFSQKHASKILDHMCVKAYKNQEFLYICIDLGDVRVIKKRRYNQSMNGMEIRLKSGHGYLFYFHQKNIDKFITILKQSTKNAKNRIDTVFKDPYDEYLASNHTTLWIDKKISNWQYLQWLNDIAGRSYNDITQYPVLPWIFVQDLKAPETVLNNQKSYRDLTKNMGSFGPPDRIKHFMDKYENVGEHEIFSEYHFGTHYSSSAIIFNYLIRLRPFSVGAVTLQSGKFDCADRVFSSYIGSWNNATNSPTDIRELIPQIFLLPEMMININGYDFGLTQLKQRICNVEIPKWCHNNPYYFCKYLRKSLQSEYVSQKINNWIDLIYGYKQKGPAAVESMNIFFPLTYQLAINVDKILQPQQKISIQTQIAHFGQNPAQIIGSSPHPLKSSLKQKWQNKLIADCNDLIIQKCSLSKTSASQVKFIYQSVFEDKNSILSIKFLSQSIFIVLRRYQFCLFKILDNKSGFISKEKEVEFVTEKDNISLDYENISTYVPMVTVIYRVGKGLEELDEEDGLTGVSNLAIVGGFYHGTLQIIYLNDIKASGVMKMPFSTITALAYSQDFQYLYIGDSEGRLGVYSLHIKHPFSPNKQLQLTQRFHQQVHDKKINSISLNKSANLFTTCSQDGTLKLFNSYSQQLYRKVTNPSKSPIIFSKISTCPLYCILFYSQQNATLYSYSINGQFLSSVEDSTGFIYNMGILVATDRCQYLSYLNAHREIYILQLPQLKLKKKIRLKKDQFKISCFQMMDRIAIAGSQDGALQIIADPSCF